MPIQQPDAAHKPAAHNPQPTGCAQVAPRPEPRFVCFGSVTVIGQPHKFHEIGGDDPDLNGWGGVLLCVADCDMFAVRSPDGLTIYLLPLLTDAKWGSRA